MAQPQSIRRYELDWLKVIVTLLVLFFHTSRVFDSEGWEVKDDPFLAREGELKALIDRGRHTRSPLLPGTLPASTLERYNLPDAERTALGTLATSTDRVTLLPGEIQTGVVYYSRTLRALAALGEQLKAAGGPTPRGLMPDGTYAQNFERGTAIRTEALTDYLARPLLPAAEVLIVDRAAFKSAGQVQQLLKRTETVGNRVVILGQPVLLGAELLVSFLNQWFMPLFFLISGVGTWFALGTRSAGRYVRERSVRLLVPFLFGCLVIVPPQSYFKVLVDPQYAAFQSLSYLEFYPKYWAITLSKGIFNWGHLWFVLYLFVFSLVALPLFIYLRGDRGQAWVERLARACEKPGWILLAGIPAGLIEAALRVRWGFGNYNLFDDWSDVCYYLLFFIYGYLLSADPRFGQAIDRHWRLALGLAVSLMVPMFAMGFLGLSPERAYTPAYLGVMLLHGLRAWLWLVGILGCARRYLNFRNRLLVYAGEAAYPFYILHQTVIVAVGFYVVRLTLGAGEKWSLIALVSLALTLGLYEVLVRRTELTRFLFGLKAKPVHSKVTAPGASSL